MEVSIFSNRTWAIILTLVLAIAGCGDKWEEIKKAKQIKKGMTHQEVIEIMGTPRTHQKDIKLTPGVWEWEEAFYYDVSFFLSSEDIIVWFDTLGKVGQVSYPKGTSEEAYPKGTER